MKIKFEKFKFPKTSFGFPVEESLGSSEEQHPSMNSKNRGIALLIAIMMVAIVMGFMADMIISSSVNVELAANNRDRIKAEYMAKSGINMALFLNSIDWGIDLVTNQTTKKGATNDGVGDIWSAINGLPIGGATMKLLSGMEEKFNLGKVRDSGVMEQLQKIDGQFVINVTDESSKVNVNYCFKGRCSQVLMMLEALFSCKAEKAFLEKKELEPREMALRIKDYLDTNKRAEEGSGFSDEDDPYVDKIPKYQAKNKPLDSLEELKMIEGWDDEMHAVFGPYLTVYPFQIKGRDAPKININTASRSMLSCLVSSGLTEECNEKFTVTMANQAKEKVTFTEGGDVNKVMNDLLCYQSPEDKAEAKGEKNKANWFSGSSKVFRFEVTGEAGNQSKKIFMIMERLDSKEMKTKKITQSYEKLFWKML